VLQTTFEEARAHLEIVLRIDLQRHLDFRHPGQLEYYALLGALIVAYRYAEALGQHVVIFDMNTGGHKSHLVGTELDFDYQPEPHDPVNQVNVISDLLRVREAMRPEMNAFRLGFYFDRFDDTEALEVRTFADFQRTYGSGRHSSMHLGVRYKFQSQDYHGAKTSSLYGEFAFWGQGSEGFGKSGLWARRIRSWDIGFIRERADLVAAAALEDLAALDQSPPTMVVLGAGLNTGPVR
jgi:hypothetical protein